VRGVNAQVAGIHYIKKSPLGENSQTLAKEKNATFFP
jgi:hypothetical protein